MSETIVNDGLKSAATKMGTAQDKIQTASYHVNVLDDTQLEAAYRTSWICRKIVTLPAVDATRKWREFSGENRDKIEMIERRFRVRRKVREAVIKSRLYGSAVMLIGADRGNLADPINTSKVGLGGLEYLTVLTPREISIGEFEDDPREVRYGKPRYYEMGTNKGEVLRIDPSRVVEFTGADLPTSNTFGGKMGDSVLQAAYAQCLHLDSTMANIATLVFDAKTDIIRIPRLMENISDPNYEQDLVTRANLARMIKGNQGILMLDTEEEYETKPYSFGGLDSVSEQMMQVVSGAADIPTTRLFGRSASGLTATGKNDMQSYYEKIAGIQELDIRPSMEVLDEVIVRTALGDFDESVTYKWRPLHEMSEQERSETRNRDADTIHKLAASQLYDDEVIAEAGAHMFSETGIGVFHSADGNIVNQDDSLKEPNVIYEWNI